MLIESLIANQTKNFALKEINLYMAGGDGTIEKRGEGYEENVKFSDAAKANIVALKAKGIEVRDD